MTPKEAIISTVAAWGAGDPSALIRIAERESRLRPSVVGDVEKAGDAYDRVRDQLVQMGNPWATDRERWAGSFGLYQLMAPYAARLWSPKADPHVLFDPRVATVVAARLWNRAVRAGATDFVRVRLFWANPNWVNIPSDDDRYLSRLDKWSIVDGQMNPRVEQFDYGHFGYGPQDGQASKLPTMPAIAGESPGLLRLISYGWLAWRLWRAYAGR